MRGAIPACLAFLAMSYLSGCAETGDSREVGTKESSKRIPRAARLIINDASGDLKVSGTKESELKVLARVRTSQKPGKDDESALSEVDVDPEISGDDAKLDLRWDFPKNYGANVEVEANRELKLEITDGSGDIEISDWAGKVVIQDGSGDIVLKNVESYEVASKTSGDLIVDGEEKAYD